MGLETDLKDKIDGIGRAFEEFKKANNEALEQIKSKGNVDPLLKSQVDKANEAISKFTDDRDKLFKEIEGIKTALNRPGAAGNSQAPDSEYKNAFNAWLRKGREINPNLIPPELKSLSDDSDPDGGYLVRPELSATIVKKIFETSPIRPICDVETISSDILDVMSDTDEVSAGWTAERDTRSSTATARLSLLKIPAQELYAEPVATVRQLDDAMWDVEKWLSEKVADKIARLENTAFIAGSGVGQPKGITTYANGTTLPGTIEQIVSGNANLLTADGLLSTFYHLKEPYQMNATWLMQRLTVLAVRQFKDGFGRYLWEPSLTAGNPDLLVGRPIVQAADMPSVSAGNLAVAVGDFKKGYKIVDRMGIRVLRDPYTTKGSVLFYTTKRTGGDVVNFEAIKLNVVST